MIKHKHDKPPTQILLLIALNCLGTSEVSEKFRRELNSKYHVTEVIFDSSEQLIENISSLGKLDFFDTTILIPHGTIWLHACSTGASNGNIAEKLSLLSNRVVYAPNDILFAAEVDHRYRNNKFELVFIDNYITRKTREEDSDTEFTDYDEYQWIEYTPPSESKKRKLNHENAFKKKSKRSQKKSKEVKRSQKRF